MERTLLLAIHNEDLSQGYAHIGEIIGYRIITPLVKDSTAELIAALKNSRPKVVVMDINYGNPGSRDISPILEIALTMEHLKYDLKTSLFGITGLHGNLISRLNRDGINAVMKPDSEGRILNFLRQQK